MKSTIKFCGSLASLIVGATFLVGSASAQVSGQVVKFDDLNLKSQAGVERLYERVLKAAWKVCDNGLNSYDMGTSARVQSCIHDAQDRAVRQINSSTMTAFYENRTGRSVASMAVNIER